MKFRQKPNLKILSNTPLMMIIVLLWLIADTQVDVSNIRVSNKAILHTVTQKWQNALQESVIKDTPLLQLHVKFTTNKIIVYES